MATCPNCKHEIDITRRTLDHLHPDSGRFGLGTIYVCGRQELEPSIEEIDSMRKLHAAEAKSGIYIRPISAHNPPSQWE